MPAPPQSWEGGVPEDAILLSEAFALFCRAAIPKWQEIENAAEAALNDQSEITRRTALDVLDAATRDAELEFRKHLATGKPRALMRDPATGANVAVSRAEWTARQSFAGMGFSEVSSTRVAAGASGFLVLSHGVADHRSRIIRKHARHRREVADIAIDDAEQRDDRRLVRRDRIENCT